MQKNGPVNEVFSFVQPVSLILAINFSFDFIDNAGGKEFC